MMMDPVLRPGTNRLTDRAGALMNSVHIIGRLKPGVSIDQSGADLDAIAAAPSDPSDAAAGDPRSEARFERAGGHRVPRDVSHRADRVGSRRCGFAP
jgi:hypothetical protein